MHCVECEQIEDFFFEQTTMWIALPTKDSCSKLSQWLSETGQHAETYCQNGLTVVIGASELAQFIMGFNGAINARELAATMISTSAGDEPTVKDLHRVITGEALVNRHHGEWIVGALEANRYESWFQPIVHAQGDAAGQVFAHEALFRMFDNDNTMIPPGHVFSLADKSDLLFSLDLAARRSAVDCASRAKLGGKLFINFNPSSIYDPSYCLRTTAAAISERGFRPEDIVFELTETHKARDMVHLKGILAFYRSAGFAVALDDVGSGYASLNLLHEVRPDYTKIDMELIRGVDKDAYKQAIVSNLVDMSRLNGVRTVAEGIETEGEAEWMRGVGVDYLQGYFFGKPEKRAA